MDLTSPEMQEIAGAVMLLHQGQNDRGRARLLELWSELSNTGTPLQICTLAHFLADTETDPARELDWDLRALTAATGSAEPEDLEAASPAMAGFLPSLHLSVAEGFRRQGDLERARRHVAVAAARMDHLPDDDYGRLIRGGLRRLQASLQIA